MHQGSPEIWFLAFKWRALIHRTLHLDVSQYLCECDESDSVLSFELKVEP